MPSQRQIYVTKPSMPSKEEYFAEVSDLWETGILTHSGVKHQELERHLLKFLDVPYITLFTNGHLGLEAAFSLFPAGGEVITTPFTFVSTTLAIVRAGLTPVFCDIEPEQYTLDPSLVEKAITPNTVAIAPVHVYGNVCDCGAIDAIAKAYNLKVVYDAAHAFGECVDGAGVATFGDMSMFSFHATKVFNTGEGGGVACSDGTLKRKLDAWKYYGFETSGGDVEVVGANAKMTEFAAAMGLCNLRHFAEEQVKRAHVCACYRNNLNGVAGIHFCPEQPHVQSNYAYLPVTIESELYCRDVVVSRMDDQGVHSRKYFYPLTSEYTCFEYLHANPEDTPIALKASREVLTLPLYADLSEDDINRVCEALVKALR